MSNTDHTRQSVDKLILGLGSALDIGGLSLDDDALCLLEIDGGNFVEIEYREDTEKVVLTSEIGTIPDALQAAWFPRLLEANAFWVGTGGATLGVHQVTGKLIQCYQEPVRGMAIERFVGFFDAFVQSVQQWQQRILEDPNQSQQSQPADALQLMGQLV